MSLPVRTSIVEGPLPPLHLKDDNPEDGAELIFHGRVRGTEEGQPILGLRYEVYPSMAQRELQSLAETAKNKFSLDELVCEHRVGDVSVGEASLRVVIRSAHRLEALEAMAWFVTELKRTVPIWKWARFENGTTLPCGPCEGCAHGEHQSQRNHDNVGVSDHAAQAAAFKASP